MQVENALQAIPCLKPYTWKGGGGGCVERKHSGNEIISYQTYALETKLNVRRIYLHILHGIPVMLQKDDCVGSGQIQAKSPHPSCEQHDRNLGILIEFLNNGEPS